MSLIDLIISQKLILITVGLALLPLFVALLIGAISRLRASSAKRARRKAKQAAAAAIIAAQAAPIADSRPVSAPIVAKVNAQPISPTPIMPEAASTATPGQPTLVTSIAASSTPAAQAEGQLSSAMQDILSSVFVDEESEARYVVLLQDVERIDMSDLLALSQRVKRQLGLGIMPAANKEQ